MVTNGNYYFISNEYNNIFHTKPNKSSSNMFTQIISFLCSHATENNNQHHIKGKLFFQHFPPKYGINRKFAWQLYTDLEVVQRDLAKIEK